MFEIELKSFSLSDLKKLEKDVAKAISTFEARNKSEARAKAEAVARELGFSLEELLDAKPARKRIAPAAKYQHPEKPEITWSGRGRKPRWIIDGLAAGKSLQDFAT